MSTRIGWYAAVRVDLRNLGDVADVVREAPAVDHRFGIVEDDRAAHVGKLPCEQPGLLMCELGFEFGQLCGGVDPAQHREAVLGEERLEPVGVGGVEDAGLRRERAPGRRSGHVLTRVSAVWVKTSTRRMRASSVSSNARHSGVRNGAPSTATVSDSSANARSSA